MMETGKSAITVIFTFLVFIVLSSNSLASAGSFVINLVEEHEKFVDPNLLEHYAIFENMLKKVLENKTVEGYHKVVEKHGDFTYKLEINSINEIGNQTFVDLMFWIYWRDFMLPFKLAIRPPMFPTDSLNNTIIIEDKLFRFHYNITYPKTIISEEEAWNILVNYLKEVNYKGSLNDINRAVYPWKRFVMLYGDEVYLPPNFADVFSNNIKYNVSAGVWIPAYIFFWGNWTLRKDYHLYISAIDGKILDYGYQEIRTYCDSYDCVSNTQGIGSNFWDYSTLAAFALITSIILITFTVLIANIKRY